TQYAFGSSLEDRHEDAQTNEEAIQDYGHDQGRNSFEPVAQTLENEENRSAISKEETSGTTTKFVPVIKLYPSVKNGVLQNENVSYHCITMMEKYKEFSLEELRDEDYLFNRGKLKPPKEREGHITMRRFSEIKFNPQFSLDTTVKNGKTHTVDALPYCVVAMAKYTNTSLGEPKVKDYERWLRQPYNASFNAFLSQEEEVRRRTGMETDPEFLSETTTTVAASMIHHGNTQQRDGAETICTKYLEDRCKDPTCQFLHPDQKLPYMWQINLADKSWASLPMNVKIEDKFCASADRTEIYNIIQFKANLYAVQGGSNQPVAVRRLSTPAYTLKKDVWEAPNTFATQWRWFWQDDEDGWNKFTPDSLQQTLEIRYRTQKTEQNEQRYYSFFLEDGTYLYDVDLQQMTQTNIVTSKTRELRRRPLLVMPNDIIYQKGKRKSMQIKAKRLGRDKDLEIRELFHGTDTLEAARGICIHTIDPRVSGKHGTAFGHGAYFARDACYSDRYTTGGSRFVFLTSVLVGEYTKGNKDYRRPPSKPGTMHGDLFDTCVDSITDPAVFVAFDRAQYYPGYLIVYKNRR
ncbi:PARPT-like protein, partial [Mya arenaria]